MSMHQRANTDHQEKSTLVLDEHFSHDRFASYMRSQGWTVRNRNDSGAGGDRSIEEVWGKDGVGVAVHYLDDPSLWTKALWIRGPDIRAVLADLSPRFGGPTAHELLDQVAEAETTEERAIAIVRLAVGFADAFDPNVLDVVTHFANDESIKVRGAVIQALLYTEWPEGLPLLKKMAVDDQAQEIRDYAANVVMHLTQPKDQR
jgi:hypothetical protein